MIIKNKSLTSFLSASIVLGMSFTASADVDYQQALKAQAMLPQIELASVNNRQEQVQFSRVIESEKFTKQKDIQPVVTSNEYSIRVTGEQLNKGLAIDTSGVGSLVKISPVNASGAKTLKVEDLMIITPSGKRLDASKAMGFKANSQDLQATPFPQGTSVFKFDSVLGAGQFKMQVANKVAGDQEYVVSVLEKDSPYQLKMQANSQQFFAGQNFKTEISLTDFSSAMNNPNLSKGKKPQAAGFNQVSGKIVAPDGREFKTQFSRLANGNYQVNMPMDLPLSAANGLWEIKVNTQAKSGALIIRRDARLAFAYNPVTALVEKSSLPKTNKAGHVLSNVVVDVTYAGRFEVKGILFGQSKGRLIPLMEAQTAKWLEPGESLLELKFDNARKQFKSLGIKSFVVKNIVLSDQTRMSVFPQAEKVSTIATIVSMK